MRGILAFTRKIAQEKNMNELSDNKNLEELIVQHRPRLKAFISKRIPNREDAEDILQDVFYQYVKTVRISIQPVEQISAWLFKVARNTIINKLLKRKEIILPVYQYDDDEAMNDFSEILFSKEIENTPETEYLRSLVWTELDNALLELPPEQREVFEMTELEGIPVKDIAEAAGISVNTVLSRKHYAILHLRKRLSELYDEILSGE